MAQLAEHVIGNDEVPSSNLGSSSKQQAYPFGFACCFFYGAATRFEPGFAPKRHRKFPFA